MAEIGLQMLKKRLLGSILLLCLCSTESNLNVNGPYLVQKEDLGSMFQLMIP